MFSLPDMKGKERKIGVGISFSPVLLSLAENRTKEAGFRSISAYIANLIESDLSAPHDGSAPRLAEVAHTEQEVALLALFRSSVRSQAAPLGQIASGGDDPAAQILHSVLLARAREVAASPPGVQPGSPPATPQS
jgi:hypothetical protein